MVVLIPACIELGCLRSVNLTLERDMGFFIVGMLVLLLCGIGIPQIIPTGDQETKNKGSAAGAIVVLLVGAAGYLIFFAK